MIARRGAPAPSGVAGGRPVRGAGAPLRRSSAPAALPRAALRLTGLAAALLIVPTIRADGQRVAAGAQYAFASYAEQGASLRFGGSGASGHLAVSWRRLALTVGTARLAFAPDGAAGDGIESFDMAQTEASLRVRATKLVSVEGGVASRRITPRYAAQSAAWMRLGARAAFPLAVGSDVAVRAAYLAGSRFSGGGTAPLGVEVGLSASHAPWTERLRLTGDLEFVRLDRRIRAESGILRSPIQGSVARIGVAIAH